MAEPVAEGEGDGVKKDGEGEEGEEGVDRENTEVSSLSMTVTMSPLPNVL